MRVQLLEEVVFPELDVGLGVLPKVTRDCFLHEVDARAMSADIALCAGSTPAAK